MSKRLLYLLCMVVACGVLVAACGEDEGGGEGGSQESGVRGAELLLAALEGAATVGRQLQVELVVRSTTAECGSNPGGTTRQRTVRRRERRRQARQEGKRVRS